MQQKQRPAPSIRRPTRLIKYPPAPNREHDYAGLNDVTGVATQPTISIEPVIHPSLSITPPFIFDSIPDTHPDDISSQTTHLMRLKVTLGLLIGIGLLCLASRFVDIPAIMQVLRENLATPRGIILGLLSGLAFLTAFSIRGMRWKLFLNPIGKVSTLKTIQLFLVGIFLNFLLPLRGGEVAKSLMLKRIAGIPVSQSLPTIAMDKALDLMPALFIMALVPLLGVQMDIKLWLVLGVVGGLLLGLVFFVGLSAWKRT